MALTAATFATVMWLLSVDDDPRDKQVASSFFWAMFWPIIWLSSRLTGKDLAVFGPRRLRPRTSTAESNVGAVGRDVVPFKTVRDAKGFLAGKIVEEAAREGVPLTEVERKMLYFTETGWTLPDMKEVSAEFDRDYNQEEYERKIAGLVGRIQASDEAQSELEQGTWDRAVEKLSEGDHYLIVLICAVQPQGNPARHWLKVLAIALVLLALAALNSWFRQWLRDH